MASKSSRSHRVVSHITLTMSTTISDRFSAAPPRPAHGLTPPVLDESVHTVRCLAQLRSKDKDIEKYIYLSQLKDADPNMFFKICLTHMSVRA